MTRPKALIFDVFGTLVDWRSSIARAVAALAAQKGIELDALAFADAWRAEYDPSMKRIRDGGRGYVPLEILHAENLERVLMSLPVDLSLEASEKADLTNAWERLDPWPDVVRGLELLKSKAIIAPCSNGSIALMTRLAKYGALPWDCILGAEIAQDYKPKHAVYQASCKALRLEPGEVMMIACHNGDLAAAQEAGLQTGFIPRLTEHGPEQKTDLTATGNWTIIAQDLHDLARKIT